MAQNPGSDHEFFATCPRSTEGLLLDELRTLGAPSVAETRAGVAFSGPLALAYRACLWSRVASRVLLRLAAFPAQSTDDLYEGILRMLWEDHLDARGTLAVEVTSTIRQGPLAQLNTHFAEQRVKDAVVDRFRTRSGERPGVDISRPNVRINVHLTPAQAVVSLDLSGEALHRRRYRLEGGEAPLKENLAAAILLRAGWPRVAAAGGPLIDPMCGSGSFLIEGALMAADVAPGLLRDYFGFLGWLGFDPHAWRQLLAEADERRELGLRELPKMLGFDVDPRALGAARANARRAGLAGRILFERGDIASLALPKTVGPSPGLVIVNPPYGKRLGETSKLVSVYEVLGERLKAWFPGWEAAVFAGNPELGAHLGLRAHRINVFYNGPLKCKLLQFRIESRQPALSVPARMSAAPRAGGPVTTLQAPGVGGPVPTLDAPPGAAPPATPVAPNAVGPIVGSPGAQMFANRLQKNCRRLRRWAERDHVTCYRLYDADLPEYAVAVDVYGEWAHVQEYAPPRTVDPVRARRRLREIMEVVPEVLGIPPEHAILKIRRRQRGSEQYRKLADAGRFLEVGEGGLRFLVNLTDYLDTGLFLDQRITRGMLRELAGGKRFLNLFAYTGSATVYAAAGGAISTTSVDMSVTYLDWARRNLALNGFSGPEHGFVRADCVEWLAWVSETSRRPRAGETYDLIYLDGPTFSNSKSMIGTLDIQRDHATLIHSAARILSTGGTMLFSTNYRRFKFDPALVAEYAVADITRQTIPPDFARNPRIHSCFRIERR